MAGRPALSGVDALARLRADPRAGSVPDMAKPIRVRELVERVRLLCEPGAGG